jgi:tetratricopeptide (TPR) repeat protein
VPIDRISALRKGEQLLRQKKPDLALAEYLRVLEDQPRDWNTANLVGDLYVQIGHLDKAVDQFTRLAEGLEADGFLSRAAAVYKKILKLKVGDEQALLRAADLAVKQGLLADARAHLETAADERRRRGDDAGAASIADRIASLDGRLRG